MTGKSRNSTRARRICFEAHKITDAKGKVMLICHVCAGLIDPARDEWHADHIARFAEDGPSTGENLWPIHARPCHAEKSAKDTTEFAKGKRGSEKRLGVRLSKRPMAGSRRSGWKRTMSGKWEKRK